MKIKPLFLFLIILLNVFTLLSCENTQPDVSEIPKGMKLTENNSVDYYFYYPDRWILDRNDKMIGLKLDISTSILYEKYSSISIISSTLSDPDILANTYWQDYEKDLESTYNDYEFISSEEMVLDNIIAVRKSYYAGLGADVYYFDQVLCAKNGVIYILTLTTEKNSAKDILDDFNAIVKHFHFK